MNKIVLALFALVAVCAAEPPSSYGAPSAFSSFGGFSSGGSSGGYDDGGNDGAQFVDSELLARVAQILEQSEQSSSRSAYSAPSSSYGAPPSNSYGAPPSSSYGAPSSRFGGGGINLGRPERAQRVAEFDLSSSSGGFRSGGYNNGGYN